MKYNIGEEIDSKVTFGKDSLLSKRALSLDSPSPSSKMGF
jgi:hypothetical protein